ncbi:MAG: elongation factor G [Bacilli bacterium]|jgi:elongation factor G
MQDKVKNIRNILFLGHQGSGKTSLVESIVSYVNKTPKGSIERKNTVSDFTDEEKSRLSSCSLSVITLNYEGYQLNLLDAPGNDNFISDIIGALNMVKGAVLVIDAQRGIEVGTVKHYNLLVEHGIPTFIYLNKMDKEDINFQKLLDEISEKLGKEAVPFVYPLGHGEAFDGFINVLDLKAYRFDGKKAVEEEIHDDKKAIVTALNNEITEKVALTSDELLEKFFSEIPLTKEEVQNGIHQAIMRNELRPIVVGSINNDIAVPTLLKMLITYLPSPSELKAYEGVDENNQKVERKTTVDAPFSAYVFKTMFDQYKGATNIIKVCSGTLRTGDDIYIPSTRSKQRVGQIHRIFGEKLDNIQEAYAGEIVALTKLDNVNTGDTLSDVKDVVILPKENLPTAVYFKAVKPVNPRDDEKLFSSLLKLQAEDPVLEVKRNNETKQLLIGGLSDSHLAFVLEKIKNMFNIPVETFAPKIAYRETVKQEATAPGRYIKQSGGSGFYGVVEMRFGPSGSEENVFAEEIFGGAVPKNYFPAVEKGFRESLEQGLLAGFPVVGMKAVLIDGKYHSVDSNEQAFRMAAVLAYREAYLKCDPTLLEPVMKLSIYVNNEFTGNVMNDLNQRRSRIISMDEKANHIQEIVALVPESETLEYASTLRVLSQGSGYFNREFDSYQEVPRYLVDNIIKTESRLNKEGK